MAQTGVLPTDPNFLALCQNDELLQFTAHWLRKRDEDSVQRWAKVLGVLWERADVEAMLREGGASSAPNELFIPLAMGVNPDLREGLRAIFRVGQGSFIGGGEYITEPGEKIESLGDADRDTFLRYAQAAVSGAAIAAERGGVTIREGETDDPRLERMRAQIAESKRY